MLIAVHRMNFIPDLESNNRSDAHSSSVAGLKSSSAPHHHAAGVCVRTHQHMRHMPTGTYSFGKHCWHMHAPVRWL